MNVYIKGLLFLYNPVSVATNIVIDYVVDSVETSASYIYRAFYRTKYFIRKKKTTNII